MKSSRLLIAVAIAVSLFSAAAYANVHGNGHSDAAHASQSAAAGEMTAGEIRKVDKDAGKITIRHAPLKNLDMPAMTMVFRVRDPSMLEQFKAGDKVDFIAEKAGGQYVVTSMQPKK